MAFAPVFSRPFAPTFDRHAAAGNGLLNNLIAYWKLDEASGDALDAHTNGLTLTQVGAPGRAAGKIGTARSCSGGQNFERNDDAFLSTGNVDFTISGWMYMTTVSANQGLLSRWGGPTNREYTLYYNYDDHAPNNRFTFAVSSNGTAYQELNATTFGAASINTWYHVIAWHDSANDELGISINGITDTLSYSSGVFNSSSKTFAAILFTSVYLLSGRLDEIGFWKSAAGGGGVLTAAQRTALYNAGAGLAYAQFTA